MRKTLAKLPQLADVFPVFICAYNFSLPGQKPRAALSSEHFNFCRYLRVSDVFGRREWGGACAGAVAGAGAGEGVGTYRVQMFFNENT